MIGAIAAVLAALLAPAAAGPVIPPDIAEALVRLRAFGLAAPAAARQRPFLKYLAAGKRLPVLALDRSGKLLATERAAYSKKEDVILFDPSVSRWPVEARAAVLAHELRHYFDWTIQARWIGGGEAESSDAEYRAFEAMVLYWEWARPAMAGGAGSEVVKELDARLDDRRRGFLRDYVEILYSPTAAQRLATVRRRLARLEGLLDDLPARFDLEVLQRRKRGYLSEEKLILRDLELQQQGL